MKLQFKPIASPFNYTGGKFKLLPQIFPLFPEKADRFVDLFCGGGSVGVNATSPRIILNDYNPALMTVYEWFRNTDKEKIFADIEAVIKKYGLSCSSEKGYAFYGCESAKGLGSYNKENFTKLRSAFNKKQPGDKNYALLLYVLMVFSFNNQIRFNAQGEFNLPVGKRDFNPCMRKKLSGFVDRLQQPEFILASKDFTKVRNSKWSEETFVYCDPPYLISCASYNENGGWDAKREKTLLAYLDRLNGQGVKFALSNVLYSKGKRNEVLQAWLEARKDLYRVHHLSFHYANSNYHTKDREKSADEILVVNFHP